LKWNAFIKKKGGLFNSLPPINHEEPTTTTTTTTDLFPSKPIVFVTGGPKSGKKTQCDRLAERYGLAHISVGEVIESSREDQPCQILDLLKATIEEKAAHCRAFLINGYPQTLD
jgi:AAA domain